MGRKYHGVEIEAAVREYTAGAIATAAAKAAPHPDPLPNPLGRKLVRSDTPRDKGRSA